MKTKGYEMNIKKAIVALIILVAQGTALFASSGALVDSAADSALAGFDSSPNSPQAIYQAPSIALKLNQLFLAKDIVSLAQYFKQYGVQSPQGNLQRTLMAYRNALYLRINQIIINVENDMREKPKGTWDIVDALIHGRDCYGKYIRQVRLSWDEVAMAKAIVSIESLYSADHGTDMAKAASSNKALLKSLAVFSNCLLAEIKQYRPSSEDARSRDMGKLLLKMAIKRNLPIYLSLKKEVRKVVSQYRSETDKTKRKAYAAQIKPFITMAKKFSAIWTAQRSGSKTIAEAHSLVWDAMKEMETYIATLGTTANSSQAGADNPFNF